MNQKIRTVEDLLLDEKFQLYVSSFGNRYQKYWENWLKEHPESEKNFHQAYNLARQMTKQDDIPPDYRAQVWNRIKSDLASTHPLKPDIHTDLTSWRYHKKTNPNWLGMTAVFLALALMTAFLYLNYQQNDAFQSFATDFGETRTIDLPDHSQIILNANSKVKITEGFYENREVWLEGEAFFKISKKDNQQNFVVYANGVNVEVLGTQFSVNNRRNKTQVVLNSGKVKLYPAHPVAYEDTVYMKPGELVEIISSNNQITQKQVDPEVYNSWRNKILIFKQTPFTDIAQVIEDTYGYQVIFKSSELTKRKFTGTSPNDNINVLLEKLQMLYEVKIKVEEDKIIFENK